VRMHVASHQQFFSAQFTFYFKYTRYVYRNYHARLTNLRDSIEWADLWNAEIDSQNSVIWSSSVFSTL